MRSPFMAEKKSATKLIPSEPLWKHSEPLRKHSEPVWKHPEPLRKHSEPLGKHTFCKNPYTFLHNAIDEPSFAWQDDVPMNLEGQFAFATTAEDEIVRVIGENTRGRDLSVSFFHEMRMRNAPKSVVAHSLAHSLVLSLYAGSLRGVTHLLDHRSRPPDCSKRLQNLE